MRAPYAENQLKTFICIFFILCQISNNRKKREIEYFIDNLIFIKLKCPQGFVHAQKSKFDCGLGTKGQSLMYHFVSHFKEITYLASDIIHDPKISLSSNELAVMNYK
jgi:hypothetical protein